MFMRQIYLLAAYISLASVPSLAADPPPKPATTTSSERKTYYIHDWVAFPTLSGKELSSGDSIEIKAQRGTGMIVVFLASWCLPCQNLMPEILEIEKSLHPLQVKVTYIFAHDAESDALGFAAEYGISKPILADHELLKAFKNPPLPSLYLGDRNTWLVGRWHEPTPDDLLKIKALVKGMTYF